MRRSLNNTGQQYSEQLHLPLGLLGGTLVSAVRNLRGAVWDAHLHAKQLLHCIQNGARANSRRHHRHIQPALADSGHFSSCGLQIQNDGLKNSTGPYCDDSKPQEGQNKAWALALTALCLGCDVSSTSKLSFISRTVFLNVNSLAHLTLLIWGCFGQQIIRLRSPDDTDRYFPRPCPQIKITPVCSQVCRKKRAGSWRYQSCLAPPSPLRRPLAALAQLQEEEVLPR